VLVLENEVHKAPKLSTNTRWDWHGVFHFTILDLFKIIARGPMKFKIQVKKGQMKRYKFVCAKKLE